MLQKALALGLHPIVVINKVDKPNCRPDEVHDAVFELFFNLDATEAQLDFPTLYGSSKNGWMNTSLEQTENIFPLMDAIIQYVPEPKANAVSYTHLDVYKRQVLTGANSGVPIPLGIFSTASFNFSLIN